VDRDQGGTLSASGIAALTLRPLTGSTAQMAALQCVLEAAAGYFQILGGAQPGRAEAQNLFSALPAGKGYEDKFVWGLYSGAAMIGCAETGEVKPAESTGVVVAVLEKPLVRAGAHG
jgi:hypothetical protein